MKIYAHNKQLNTHKLLSMSWKTKTYLPSFLLFRCPYGRYGWYDVGENRRLRATGIENEKTNDGKKGQTTYKTSVKYLLEYAAILRASDFVHSTSATHLFDRDICNEEKWNIIYNPHESHVWTLLMMDYQSG